MCPNWKRHLVKAIELFPHTDVHVHEKTTFNDGTQRNKACETLHLENTFDVVVLLIALRSPEKEAISKSSASPASGGHRESTALSVADCLSMLWLYAILVHTLRSMYE